MAWIQVHQSVWTHRKTIAVADALDLSEVYAGAHLIALWTWALDNAPDGTLDCSLRAIARGAQWTGDSKEFVEALVGAGFLERTSETQLVLHDWDTYAGKLVDRRKANAERMRRARAQANSAPGDARAEHVRSTNGARAQHNENTCNARAELEETREDNTTEQVPNGTRRDAPDQVSPEPVNQPEPPKPRTAKQQASDAKHERRVELFAAWCRGIGLDPEGEEANVGRNVAFNHLKPIVDAETPTPEDFEACTRFLVSEEWRNAPPDIPEVLRKYGPWAGAGRPEKAKPRSRNGSARASPGRSQVSSEELDRRIREAELREQGAHP
jgi:hypothetical protein